MCVFIAICNGSNVFPFLMWFPFTDYRMIGRSGWWPKRGQQNSRWQSLMRLSPMTTQRELRYGSLLYPYREVWFIIISIQRGMVLYYIHTERYGSLLYPYREVWFIIISIQRGMVHYYIHTERYGMVLYYIHTERGMVLYYIHTERYGSLLYPYKGHQIVFIISARRAQMRYSV